MHPKTGLGLEKFSTVHKFGLCTWHWPHKPRVVCSFLLQSQHLHCDALKSYVPLGLIWSYAQHNLSVFALRQSNGAERKERGGDARSEEGHPSVLDLEALAHLSFVLNDPELQACPVPSHLWNPLFSLSFAFHVRLPAFCLPTFIPIL